MPDPAHPPRAGPALSRRAHNFIKRLYDQRTGYWKPDSKDIEVAAPAEWAAALDLLTGGNEDSYIATARTLLDRGDHVLALKLVDLT